MELCFASSAHFMMYQCGAIKAFQEVFGESLNSIFKEYSGCSGGTISSACIYFELQPEKIFKVYFSFKDKGRLTLFKQCRSVRDLFDIIVPDPETPREGFVMKENIKLSFYLSIVESTFPYISRREMSDFKEKSDIVEYGTGACHIPLIANSLFKVCKSHVCFDGFTYKNLNVKRSILVAPYWFMGYSKYYTIRPSVSLPFLWSLIAPSNNIIVDIYDLGYYDTKKFIRQNMGLFEYHIPSNEKNKIRQCIMNDSFICERSYDRVVFKLKNNRLIYYCKMIVMQILMYCLYCLYVSVTRIY
tara:strand:- start:937 stop:1839 length:903 start_codon:yes stop_codon:yes gene_type:complete